MIELPIWAFVLLVGLLPIVGLTCYWYGWRLRGGFESSTIHHERYTFNDRPMSTEERAAADEAFRHMDNAFATMNRIFK